MLSVTVVDFIDQSVEMKDIRETPTYSSPNPTVFLTYYHLEQNVGLGEG